MSAFLGADTDAVRDLASRYSQGSQRLENLREATEAFVRAVTWIGPDADEFRTRATSVLTDLAARASDVSGRARTLETEAEEQDSASSPEVTISSVGVGVGVGAGAWQPGANTLPDFSKWFADGRERDEGVKDAGDIVRRMVGKKIDDAVEAIEWANGGPGWLRGAKKFIPVVPDAIDFAHHAANGETTEAIYAIGRGGISLTPFGLVEDASAAVFPFMPDDWKLPGTDVPLNEGSIMEGYEKDAVENSSGDSVLEKEIRKGERFGADISDRLGIENDYVRNTFKTFGGISGGIGASHRDPKDGSPWYFGKDLDYTPWS